jgi:uncharacterized Zn finger protein (UPF0148 family)
MPVCPNCGYEYIEGITFCPDCNQKLVDESMLEQPEEWSEKDWQIVFTSSEDYEIEMLKDNLESAGIAAMILSQKDRNFPAPGDFSIIKLMVKNEDVPAALTFIQETMKKNPEEDEE